MAVRVRQDSTVYSVQCTVYCVLCTVYYVLCTMYYVLCTMYYVLCTMYKHKHSIETTKITTVVGQLPNRGKTHYSFTRIEHLAQ
jgi:hypothetical protein